MGDVLPFKSTVCKNDCLNIFGKERREKNNKNARRGLSHCFPAGFFPSTRSDSPVPEIDYILITPGLLAK